MTPEESRKRQDDLKECLKEMSVKIFTPNDLESMLKRLKGIYSAKFRHSYADFFHLITESWDENHPDALDSISNNIEMLRQLLEQKMSAGEKGYTPSFYSSLCKLSDHINLEIGRFNYYRLKDENMRFLEDRVDNITKKVSHSEQMAKDAEEMVNTSQSKLQGDLEEAQKEIKNIEKEYIAILGIFSSVVLTFTAGIAFSTSVLENIHQTSVYRLILGVLLIAFVLINVIFLLFHYVDKMVHGEDTKGLKFIKWINVTLVGMMVVVGFLWGFGVVERRNQFYEYESAIPTIATMTEEDLEKKIEEILNETMETTVDVDITIFGDSQGDQSKMTPATGQ